MDFNDYVRENYEKYSLAEEEWDPLKKSVILSFADDKDGKVMSWYNQVPVFRHKTSEMTILSGETWICSLDKSKISYYFAKGLQRIDASFMYDLKRDQIDEIAAVVWEEQRKIIEPILEDKYKEVMKDQISAAIENERKEYVSQIRELEELNRQLEQKDAENKQIIASLTEKVNKAQTAKQEKIQSPPAGFVSVMPDMASKILVNRDGPDTISSQIFDKPRYFVHLSADHRMLVVRPHESGNVVCIDNAMTLQGLSLVSQYDGAGEMTAEYSSKYGGIQIYL